MSVTKTQKLTEGCKLSVNVDVVQLSPRRSFDMARTLSQMGVLGLVITDCGFSRRTVKFLTGIRFLQKYRLDQYDLSPFNSTHYVVVFPAKILLMAAGLFRANSLARLFFYLSAQTLLQLAYVFYDLLLSPKNGKARYVFCFDTGAFLILAYKLLFRRDFVVYIEQCVSPRVSQLRALEMYGQYPIPFQVSLYYRILLGLEAFEHHYARLLICPSTNVSDQLIDNGVPKDKLRLIPYSFELPTDLYPPKIEDLANASPVTRFLFVGNDILRKGLPTLLTSLEMLEESDYEIHAAGNFSLSDIRKISSSAVVDRIIVHGKLNRSNLYALYRSSHVFVSPSFCEGSPITILEAASFNNLIIASFESGCNFQPFTEYLPFNAGDSAQLAFYLKSILEDRHRYLDMTIRCHEAIARFTTDAYLMHLRNILS